MKRLLALQGVCVSYHRGSRAMRVLADVSLELSAGEVVSVLATHAQGKSTLLRVAAGMQQPDTGRVLLAGEDLWGLKNARRQRLLNEAVGFVGSATPDVDLTVLAHLVTPLRAGRCGEREARLCAEEALERVGMMERAGQYWDDLSDWERALFVVAVGIVRKPRLLLVDDVTSSLGLGETDDVTRLLYEVAKERHMGVLIGVSDANATQWADRLATLGGGEMTFASSEDEKPADGKIDSRWGGLSGE